jgi:hypothetical protein
MSGSPRGRELTGLVLGTVTLPLLAAHLAEVGTRGDDLLGAYSASLVPFLAHATGAVLGGVALARLWSDRPPSQGAAP